jgi:hypothetical protein
MKLPFSFADAHEEVIENCRLSEQNKIERITKLEKDVAILQTKIIDLATGTKRD